MRVLQRMEGLPYKMSNSSLPGLWAAQGQAPQKPFNYTFGCQNHAGLSFPGGGHICTRQLPHCYVIKGTIFSSLQPWESEVRTIFIITTLLVWLPPLVLNGRYFQGLLPTYLCPNHSFQSLKLATFPSSCLACSLFSWYVAKEYSIWSQRGGCYLVWAQQEADGWLAREKLLYIHT